VRQYHGEHVCRSDYLPPWRLCRPIRGETELVVASATVLMVGAMMTGLVAMVAERWGSRDEGLTTFKLSDSTTVVGGEGAGVGRTVHEILDYRYISSYGDATSVSSLASRIDPCCSFLLLQCLLAMDNAKP